MAFEISLESSASVERRLAFINDVKQLWYRYQEEINADKSGSWGQNKDRLLHLAIDLVTLVGSLEAQTPGYDVKLGELEIEKAKTSEYIKALSTNFGMIMEPKDVLVFDAPPELVPTWPVELLLGEQVRRARALGTPWKDIGSWMGMTGQGAQKKAREKGWVHELETLTDEQ